MKFPRVDLRPFDELCMARWLSGLLAGYDPAVPDFRQQVNTEFVPYYVEYDNAAWTSSNSLFISFFGINDVGNSYDQENSTINADVVNIYAGLIDELYQAGARNFLFLNVPPVDKAPRTTAYGAAAEALEASAIADFNTRVASLASNVSSYANSSVFLFDTNALFSQVLENPNAYQPTSIYKNTTDYCPAYQDGTPEEDTFDPSCGIPVNQYFWLNTLHPTYPIHDVLASQLALMLEGSPLWTHSADAHSISVNHGDEYSVLLPHVLNAMLRSQTYPG